MKKTILTTLFLLLGTIRLVGQTTVVTFDNPAPSSSPGTMPTTFNGMTFGANWSWEGAWNADSSNNIYFSSASNTQESFGFVQPEILVSVQVCGDAAGTLTLSDDQGQTVTFQVAQTNTLYTVKTGWSKASNSVTTNYSQGWHLAYDNFTYQTPTAPGALATSITLSWDDQTPVTGTLVATQISSSGSQNTLARTTLSSTGKATATLNIDLTQADPLTFQITLLNTSGAPVGDAVTFQVPKVMFPTNVTGVTTNIVLWKSTTTIKTFDFALTP